MLEHEQNNIFAGTRKNVYQNGDNFSKSSHDFDKVNPKVLPWFLWHKIIGLTKNNMLMMVMMMINDIDD